MRSIVSAAILLGLVSAATAARAQDAESLLSEGWRLYSEELEFERAAEVFEQAVSAPDATEGQLLEALEYLAACSFALGDQEAARSALRRMLDIDRSQTLHDPSHPPDLLAMLEELRSEPAEPDEPPLPDYNPPAGGDGGTGTGTGGSDAGAPDGQLGDDEQPVPRFDDVEPEETPTPWYRTWWFWTTVGVVVAAGVTTGVAVALTSGETAPPAGNLDPGVVQLPCTGLRF